MRMDLSAPPLATYEEGQFIAICQKEYSLLLIAHEEDHNGTFMKKIIVQKRHVTYMITVWVATDGIDDSYVPVKVE